MLLVLEHYSQKEAKMLVIIHKMEHYQHLR